MKNQILKKAAVGLALVGTLVTIGCNKGGSNGGKNEGEQVATQARAAFNNCFNVARQRFGPGSEGACYQVRGQYACSISEFVYGQCYGMYNQSGAYRPTGYNYGGGYGYQWGYMPTQQGGPQQGPPTIDGYFVYLNQFPPQEVNYMITIWNRGGY